MQYFVLPTFGADPESSTSMQVSAKHCSTRFCAKKSEIMDKWPDLRKENDLHPKLFTVLEEYREDLFHGIYKGHKQQMKIQHAALIVACFIQTSAFLNYATIRQTVLQWSCRREWTHADEFRAPCQSSRRWRGRQLPWGLPASVWRPRYSMHHM